MHSSVVRASAVLSGTDIWKHSHVIELHTVFFSLYLRLQAAKLLLSLLPRQLKDGNMKISSYRKPADKVNKGMNALE